MKPRGQRDGINRVAEPLEAVESALGTVLLRAGAASALGWHGWIGFADRKRTTSAGRSPLKPARMVTRRTPAMKHSHRVFSANDKGGDPVAVGHCGVVC